MICEILRFWEDSWLLVLSFVVILCHLIFRLEFHIRHDICRICFRRDPTPELSLICCRPLRAHRRSGNTSPSAVVQPPSCVWLDQNHKNTSPKPHSRWNWLELLCMAEMFILLNRFYLYYTGHRRTERKVEGEESGHDPYQLPICHVPQLQHDWNYPDILLQLQDFQTSEVKGRILWFLIYLFIYLFIYSFIGR